MALDLRFPQRAVDAFVAAAKSGQLSSRHMRDVLKYTDSNVDFIPLADLIDSEDPWVRKCVAGVLGEKGMFDRLADRVKVEDDRSVVYELMKQLMKTRDGLERVVCLLDSGSQAVRESAIQMFRKAKREDCLMKLLFDDSDELVSRIKRYMQDEENPSIE